MPLKELLNSNPLFQSASDHVSQITHHIPIKVRKVSEMEGWKTGEEVVEGMQPNVSHCGPLLWQG
jgi:hypothetical protein